LNRTTASILLPVTALCLLLGSCFPGSVDRKLEIRETFISDHSVGLNFSMHLQDTQLYMIYPSLDALSLNLISAELSGDPLDPALGETKYLDRISYSPDIGEDFGRHLFLADDRLQHILYVDREGEENSVLKWLSKTATDDTWWIDAFPGLTEPLAAIPEQGGSLRVVVSEGTALSLYRLQPEGQPLQLAAAPAPAGAFHPMGRTHVVRQGDNWAVSVYDDRSKRLYLVHPGQDTLTIEAVHASGEVHYSTILDDRLYILLFEPATSTIFLLERAQRSFEVLPVTLCEGASSLFLTTYAGQRLFLFNERVVDQGEKTGYQLSLLYPESAGGKYEKLALVKGDGNIQGFTALEAADTLYVLYLRGDALSLLAVSLERLARSP
jgi:hypothetical protein